MKLQDYCIPLPNKLTNKYLFIFLTRFRIPKN